MGGDKELPQQPVGGLTKAFARGNFAAISMSVPNAGLDTHSPSALLRRAIRMHGDQRGEGDSRHSLYHRTQIG